MTNTVRKEIAAWAKKPKNIERLFSDLFDIKEMTFVNGSEVRGVCPIHDGADNNTAFRYSIQRANWNCFSHRCEEQCGNDLIGLVMATTRCSSDEAVQTLSAFAGTEFSYEGMEEEEDDRDWKSEQWSKELDMLGEQEEKARPLNELLVKRYRKNSHPYFLERGYKQETLDHFEVGYAEDGPLAGRLTIPGRDEDGRLVLMSGRAPFETRQKYKIYPGSEKHKTLYNINNVAKKYDEIWVVEGFPCVWRAYEFGYENFVACMGSQLTRFQTYSLLKNAISVVMAFDNDEAGMRGKERLARKIKNYATVYEVSLVKKDIGEYNTIEGFEELVKSKRKM